MTASPHSKELQELLKRLEELPTAEREALSQMRPEYKVFRASEEQRAHQDLVRTNLEDKANSRKLEGIARNSATLNTNQTKQYQLLRDQLDVAISDGHITHEVALRILKTVEVIAYEQTQFNGDVMDELIKLNEKVDRLRIFGDCEQGASACAPL